MGNETIAVLLSTLLLLQLRQLKPTGRQLLFVLAAALLCLHPRMLGSETLTLTTYYPAPYGAYVAMLTTNQTLLARDGGAVGIGYKRTGPEAKLIVNGNVGIGITNPQTPAPNGKPGNLDVNDVYLRTVDRWASESGGGGGCYVSYSGGCPAGFTKEASAGFWGGCLKGYTDLIGPYNTFFRPPGGTCPAGMWASANGNEAFVCCK